MTRLANTSKRTIRSLARSAATATAFLTTLIAWSTETPQETPQQVASPDAPSPFPRLADPGGCVIDQVTAADHDEYQVRRVQHLPSADGWN